MSAESMDVRLRDVELSTQRNEDRMNGHETLCAERYRNINDTMAAIKKILFWAGTALIAGMAAILVKLVLFL